MKQVGKLAPILLLMVFCLSLLPCAMSPALAAKKEKKPDQKIKFNAAFDRKLLNVDMSDFDPSNPIIPTGDTIKIAVISPFSGPSAINGQLHFLCVQWAAHMINKNGGIWVDGKKKLVEVLKADTMEKTDQTKKIAERMALQNKIHVFWGTSGSQLMKIINDTAAKYKIISMSAAGMSDELQDATNFSRYSFMTGWSTGQIGRGMAYYYGQIRKKEKKFYILCQDYSFGHMLADGFKQGLKEYYPQAKIVGEDYHKLILTDFAPYLEKIKASGAEVVYTGDWIPDGSNLLKQARKMGIMTPMANLFLDEPNTLNEIGIEGTKNLVNITQYGGETNIRGEHPHIPGQRPGMVAISQNMEQFVENEMEGAVQHAALSVPPG